MTEHMRTHNDLTIPELRMVREARHKGMSWRALEIQFRLKPTSGMTAFNAVRRLNRLEGEQLSNLLLKNPSDKNVLYAVIKLKKDGGVEDELFSALVRAMKASNASHEEMARLLTNVIKEVADEQKPMGYREIWKLGMTPIEFNDLCKLRRSTSMLIYEAAAKLFRLPIQDDYEKNNANKFLQARLQYLPGWKKPDRFSKEICIPDLYFPNKSADLIRRITKCKLNICGCGIGEESAQHR